MIGDSLKVQMAKYIKYHGWLDLYSTQLIAKFVIKANNEYSFSTNFLNQCHNTLSSKWAHVPLSTLLIQKSTSGMAIKMTPILKVLHCTPL